MGPDPPAALASGAELFNAGEYYRAHEAWEEHWLETGGSSRDFYKGLIQVSVALLHWERGNWSGAAKLHRSGSALLEPFAPAFHGVDVTCFLGSVGLYFAPLHDALARKMRPPRPPEDSRPRLNLEPEKR